MNKADLYTLSDLILQKLNCFQSDEVCGNIERGLLQPYAKQLTLLQNVGLIQTHANEIFGGIVQTIFCKTLHELSRKEPDIDKLLRVMKPVEDFMRDKIGYDQEEIQRRINMPEEDIESDLKTLEKEIAEWVKDMPHVVVADEVPNEIKGELNRLKEQVVNMQKENLKMEKTLAFEITPLLKEKVKEELIATQSEDVHQAIINVAYDLYEEHLDNLIKESEDQNCKFRWVYSDLCQFTKENLGSLAEFAVLMGKYNQQVENGGHSQYWYNECGSIGGRYKDLYLHMNLIYYFTIFKKESASFYNEDQIVEIDKTVNEALSIMEQLPESIYWVTKTEYAGFDSQGEFSYYDPEEGCNELSEDSRRRLEYLDNSYCEINSKLMDVINLYFYNYLNQ